MPGDHGPREYRIPEGDDRQRLVCPECNYIAYDNPKIVVGAVAVRHGDILLCRRAIEPRSGYWTIPAGYLEQWESLPEGVKREAREEAGVDLSLGPLLAIYDLPHIAQLQMFYKAHCMTSEPCPGTESLEARFFSLSEIPWDTLAFPTVTKIIELHYEKNSRSIAEPVYECINQALDGAV